MDSPINLPAPKKRVGLIACFLFLLFQMSWSQHPGWRIEHYGRKDGLSQYTIYDICQDTFGLIWVGNQNGVCKYDGYGFRCFSEQKKDTSSLQGAFVKQLYIDVNGILWVGTEKGLSRYEAENESFQLTDTINQVDSISDITDIVGYQDDLYIGSDNGLFLKPLKREQFGNIERKASAFTEIENESISALSQHDGYLWIGTNQTIYRLDSTRSLKKVPISIVGADYQIQQLYGHPQLGLIASIYQESTSRLFKYDETTQQFSQIVDGVDKSGEWVLNEPVMSLCYSSKVGLLIGTDGKGLYVLDEKRSSLPFKASHTFAIVGLGGNTIYDIFIDNTGIIWLGTNDGITKMVPFKFKHIGKTDQHTTLKDVWAIFKDSKGVLWVGTNHGLFYLADATWQLKSPRIINRETLSSKETLNSIHIFSIQEDLSGNLWLGTKNGSIYRMEGDVENGFRVDPKWVELLSNDQSVNNKPVQKMVLGPDGSIWAGIRGKGIFVIDSAGQGNFLDINDLLKGKEKDIYDLRFDLQDKKRLWIGTLGKGILCIDWQKKEIIERIDESRDFNIECIYQDSRDLDKLWIGTMRNGVQVYDKRSKILMSYQDQDSLLDKTIYGILSDTFGTLWMSSNNGIFRLDPKKEKIISRFHTEDGLQGEEFNGGAYFQDSKKEELYFGGITGLNLIKPEKHSADLFHPQVVITDLLVNKDPAEGKVQFFTTNSIHISSPNLLTKLSLPADISGFVIKSSATSYYAPERILYKYSLFRTDSDKVPNREKLINQGIGYGTKGREQLIDLPEQGEYKLEIEASQGDGTWESLKKSIVIIKNPTDNISPFSALVIITVLIIVLFFFVYQSQIEKRAKEERIDLMQIGDKIVSGLERQVLIKTFHDLASKKVNFNMFGIAIYDEQAQKVTIETIIEDGERLQEQPVYYLADKVDSLEYPVWCIVEKKIIHIDNLEVEFDKYYNRKLPVPRAGMMPKSVLYFPLIKKEGKNEKILGALTVQSLKANAFGTKEREYLEMLKNYIIVAIDNSFSHEKIVAEKVAEQQKEFRRFQGLLGHEARHIFLALEDRWLLEPSKIFHIKEDSQTTDDFQNKLGEIYVSDKRLLDQFAIIPYKPFITTVSQLFFLWTGYFDQRGDLLRSNGGYPTSLHELVQNCWDFSRRTMSMSYVLRHDPETLEGLTYMKRQFYQSMLMYPSEICIKNDVKDFDKYFHLDLASEDIEQLKSSMALARLFMVIFNNTIKHCAPSHSIELSISSSMKKSGESNILLTLINKAKKNVVNEDAALLIQDRWLKNVKQLERYYSDIPSSLKILPDLSTIMEELSWMQNNQSFVGLFQTGHRTSSTLRELLSKDLLNGELIQYYLVENSQTFITQVTIDPNKFT